MSPPLDLVKAMFLVGKGKGKTFPLNALEEDVPVDGAPKKEKESHPGEADSTEISSEENRDFLS
ncbi:hypothetical protein AMTR_s00062p00133010 [Amborella trichopoda]|uniref:Uncharacterized protein n=1 Tax=Amborella trichopoda TaxID=13333 RepID=U5DDW9_AMBTC|nr:hypothetical protein AMTR_s00062p00133010 [Amborella trichopoda]